MHTLTHTHAYTHAHTHMHITRTYTYTHTHAHTRTYTDMHTRTYTQTHAHLHISTLSDSVSTVGEIVAKITSSPTEQHRTPQFQKHYSKRWQDIFVSQLNRRQTRSEGREGAPEGLERPINHRSDINHVSSNVVMLHAIPKGTSKAFNQHPKSTAWM